MTVRGFLLPTLNMSLKRPQKAQNISEIATRLRAANIAILADYRGLSVAKTQAIRKALQENQTSFKVVKKTLLRLALRKISWPDQALDAMKEAIALAVNAAEDSSVAKILVKARKESPELKILGGFFQQKFISSEQVLELARLPTREELLAQLAGTLAGPLAGFVRVLNGPLINFTTLISKLTK